MKTKINNIYIILSLISIIMSESVSAQNLPDTVYGGGNIFKRMWVDSLKQKESRWNFADWIFETNECEFNQNAASFDDGKLLLSIKEKDAGDMGNHPSKPYWGAEYWSSDEFQYGRFVVNMKPTTPSGVVTSFFLSHIEWNNDYTQALEWYEIDIEFAGRTDQVQFTLHWIDNTGKHHTSATIPLSFDASQAFHEWAIEWTPEYIKYFVDGNLLHTFDDPALLAQQDHSQQIQMNYWVSNSPEWVGPFNSSILPITTEYDYIAYYKLANPATGVKKKNELNLHTFPNPFTEVINVDNSSGKLNYRIYSLQGALIEEGFVVGNKIIPQLELENGLYLLHLSNETGVSTKIICKQ